MNLRIRQVKPAFWTDGKIGRLAPATRLFYIGCWQLADDAGWFECDVAEMGACLYPFDAPHVRERRIESMVAELAAVGCVVVHDCGHAEVPHLTEHQRLAGPTKRVETVHKAHLNRCPADSRGFPRIPASRAPDGQERSGNGTVSTPAAAAGVGDDESQATEKTTKSRLPIAEVRDPVTGATSWVATAGAKA